MTSPLNAVYEKFKHLDGCLSDPEWCTSGEGAAIYAIAGELWRAVKEERSRQSEQPSTAIEDITPEGAAIIQQAKAQATAAENKRVVTVIHQKLKERYHLMEDAHMKQQYVIMINFVKSLRLSQPELKERDPE